MHNSLYVGNQRSNDLVMNMLIVRCIGIDSKYNTPHLNSLRSTQIIVNNILTCTNITLHQQYMFITRKVCQSARC